MTSSSVVLVPSHVASLQPFVDAGVLSAVEVHLAAWVARSAKVDDPLVALAVAMAAWATRHGHVCATLDQLPAAVERELADRRDADGADAVPDARVAWPEPQAWITSLRAAGEVVREVGDVDLDPVFDPRPLVLCGLRLYLQRHWLDECAIAVSVRARAVPADTGMADSSTHLLEQLLPAVVDGLVNRQRLAADAVVGNRMAVVVGGPGTGKTYSVARLLAVLAEQSGHEGRPLRIALAAPTGKAAARVQESISAALQQTDMQQHASVAVRDVLAAVVPTTIHRLLGPLADQRQRFRHHAANPLPHDVVVIDETSMVSLPLLARLLEAVRPDARLVLIGDPDQLESVELGAVLGDLVAASGSATSPLSGRVVRLVRGHRFEGDSPIARFADAVRGGDAAEAVRLLRADVAADVGGSTLRFVDTTDPMAAKSVATVRSVVQPVLEDIRLAAEVGDGDAALRLAGSMRVLCAHRHGRHGVSDWNRLCERWLTGDDGAHGAWYAGRPLMATRNDDRLGLSNGDTGVVVIDEGRPVAVFAAARGATRFDPSQLEAVETAYAITVHKSQGSEYRSVVLILPAFSSPLVGRELVYTGATRAQQHLLVVGDEAAVRAATDAPAMRMTGLAVALGG
jgi:exodeoxyribonuclease V alpha subunit